MPKEEKTVFEKAAETAQDMSLPQAERTAALRILLTEGSKQIKSEEERKRLATRRAEMGLGAKMLELIAKKDAEGNIRPLTKEEMEGPTDLFGGAIRLRDIGSAHIDPRNPRGMISSIFDNLSRLSGARGLDPLADIEAPGQRNPRSVTRKGGTTGKAGTPFQRSAEGTE